MARDMKTIKDAEAQIERLIDPYGRPYTHNLVGMTLRQIDEKFGREEANRLIDEYELDDLFGGNKEPLTPPE